MKPRTAATIQTPTHGRYLVREADQSSPALTLVGFHGYAETAEHQLDRLESIPGVERCRLVSIQGLHRFYRGRTEEVVASWMTRQDRELALADNAAYVAAVLATVTRAEVGSEAVLVFAGFSQGVAMAFRTACSWLRVKGPDGAGSTRISVISLGGDVPPELDRGALTPVHSVLLGHGTRDTWYTATRWGADAARLEDAGVAVNALELDAAHDWTADFSAAAGSFLDGLR